jgi:hypothetical protein
MRASRPTIVRDMQTCPRATAFTLIVIFVVAGCKASTPSDNGTRAPNPMPMPDLAAPAASPPDLSAPGAEDLAATAPGGDQITI